MKKNIFRAVICTLVLATLICAFAVMASAAVQEGPIYISVCASDFYWEDNANSRISAYSRNATVFLKEGVFSQTNDVFSTNISSSLLQPSRSYKESNVTHYEVVHAIVSEADEADTANKYVYVPAYYEKDVSTYKAPNRQLEESGLYYSYDTSTKTMTISGKIKKNADGTDVPWIIPAPGVDPQTTDKAWGGDYNVKTVIIEENTGVTRLYNHCMNNMCRVETVVIPTTLNSTECESLGRMAYLKTVKVQGSEFETGIDFRGITAAFDAQTLHTSCTQYDTVFYIGEFLAGKNNTYKTDGTLSTRILQNFLNSGTTRTFVVYTPTGEPCDFARDLEMARGTWKLVDGVYTESAKNAAKATVYVRPYAVCNVEPLGYRIRTAKYNGLRAEFGYNDAGAKMYKIVDAGAVLTTPTEESLASGAETCVEFGVIVATKAKADEFGLELTNNGGVWETADSKIQKVSVDPTNKKKFVDGKFFVTVTEYPTDKAQMGAQIEYLGYQINEDGNGNQTVVYAEQLAPVSLYDATLGMFNAGVVNSSIGDANIFWDVLDLFKIDMNDVIYEDDGVTLKCADYLRNEFMYTAETGNKCLAGTFTSHKIDNVEQYDTPNDKTASFLFKTTDDGDLYWNENANKSTLISFFECPDGSYTAIAHLTDAAYSAYKADPTKVGQMKSGSIAKNYVQENFLSTNFIQIPIKTIVVDDGIGTALVAFKGLGTYAPTTKYYKGEEGSREVAYIDYKGAVETIILPQSLTGFSWDGQVFHSDFNLRTIYTFGTADMVVEDVLDISHIPSIKPTANVNASASGYLSEYFNRCQAATTVKFPELDGFKCVLGKNIFAQAKNVETIYVGDTNVTSSGMVDFTGTGYSFNCVQPANDFTKGFEGVAKITKIINDDGTVNTRTSGNTWTVTPAA